MSLSHEILGVDFRPRHAYPTFERRTSTTILDNSIDVTGAGRTFKELDSICLSHMLLKKDGLQFEVTH